MPTSDALRWILTRALVVGLQRPLQLLQRAHGVTEGSQLVKNRCTSSLPLYYLHLHYK